MAKRPSSQIPGVYHRRLGEMHIVALSDGLLFRDHTMMRGVAAEQADALLKAAYRKSFVLSVNTFLIFTGDQIVLIETGSGNYLGPAAGHLLASLNAAGVAPQEINTILLTHMHPDHSAGLTDMATGHAHYANAELVVHENEPRHWFDDAAMARGTDREKKLMFQQAREQTAPYRARMRTFASGTIMPGISAIPSHGHTPGHTSFLLESDGERLLIWGDAVHFPEVQLPRPEVSMVVDVDPAAAAVSRRRMFEMAASERLLVTGMHLHFPGFGRVEKNRDSRSAGFTFIPEAWQQTL